MIKKNLAQKEEISKEKIKKEDISKEKLNQLRSKISNFDSALKAAEDIKAKVWEIDYISGYLNTNHDIPHNSILKID